MAEARSIVVGLVRVAALLLLAALAAGAARAQGEGPPAQLLLVASDAGSASARRLAVSLEQGWPVTVEVIDSAEYRPLIDEAAHDGFVYLGEDYFAPPTDGFLADMARTHKPLLWINYHAWRLPAEMAARSGIAVQDRHDLGISRLRFGPTVEIGPVDTSRTVVRPPARVLSWLYPGDMSYALPGAVTSPAMTYVAYLPRFDDATPGWPAFRAAAEAALERVTPSAPRPVPAGQRLAAARADSFRSMVHVPFVADERVSAPRSYADDSYHAQLLRLRSVGAEWVALNRTFFQEGTGASRIEAHAQATASFADLENVVRDAHALGLFVHLTIVVNLTEQSRGANEWRGMIRPRDPDAWWREYREIVLSTAEFAQRMGIAGLSIGAELNALQVDAREWRALARDVREVAGYEGLVGYQVNYNALDTLDWADALDLVSVAAYWPLADDRDPEPAELDASWRQIGAELSAWQEAHPDTRLEFGEIGYASQPYAALFPFSWRPNRGAALSLEEQLACYRALERFLRARPGIGGVGVFASTAHDGNPTDMGYTPFGKPAEAFVRRLMELR